MKRCWADEDCYEDYIDVLEDMNDRLDEIDLPGALQQTYGRIADAVSQDPRHPWSMEEFEAEVECLREWTEHRPEVIREFLSDASSDASSDSKTD